MKKFVASLVALLATATAYGQVSTNGTGTVYAKPECAHVSLAVVTENTTASIAHGRNRDVSNKVFDALKALGIEDKDVGTAGFHVGKLTDDKGVFRAYGVHHHISVRIRDLTKVGSLIDKVVNDTVMFNGITFEVANRSKLEDEARAQAVADAKRKAEQVVAGLGVKLGAVRSVSESAHYRADMYAESARSMAPSAPGRGTTVQAGEQAVQVTVAVTWEVDSGIAIQKKPVGVTRTADGDK